MNYAKTLLLAASTFLTASSIQASAPDSENTNNLINTAQMEVRVDWQRDQLGGSKRSDESGFKGKFVNLILKGDITDNVSYAYRQRFSKSFGEGKFFDATDWLYITYRPTDKWELSGGKQIVAMGGFEYDYAPIDIYQYTEYCNMIGCYQFGASAAYKFTPHDQLTAQVVQSPFHTKENNDLYGYNLKWVGNHGMYTSIWSASLHEYEPNHYINYIALGNCFKMGNVQLLLDYTNRYAKGYGSKFLGDFTFSTEVKARVIPQLNVITKYSIDHNDSNGGDYCVYAGTKQHHAGVGVEFFPNKGKPDLRLHANFFHTWGENGNPDGVLQNKQSTINVGITWRANLLNIKNYLPKK